MFAGHYNESPEINKKGKYTAKMTKKVNSLAFNSIRSIINYHHYYIHSKFDQLFIILLAQKTQKKDSA